MNNLQKLGRQSFSSKPDIGSIKLAYVHNFTLKIHGRITYILNRWIKISSKLAGLKKIRLPLIDID